MIKHVKQDIFEAPIDILIHQCNCFHVMGGGIAKEIRERFPNAYSADLMTKRGDYNKLGTYSVAEVEHENIRLIVNLYSQFGFGNCLETRYSAMRNGLESICKRFAGTDLVIGIPYKIGCGLAGGNWHVVEPLIKECFFTYDSDVLICEK